MQENLKRYIARAVESAGSTFERLVFLGSLRDAYTGKYIHEGWGEFAAADEVHVVLKEVHHSLFMSLVSLSIFELSKELRFHFRMRDQAPQETCILWLETEPFRDLVPRGCSRILRELFILQMKTALELLCRVPDWEKIAGPAASQHSRLDQRPLLRWLN